MEEKERRVTSLARLELINFPLNSCGRNLLIFQKIVRKTPHPQAQQKESKLEQCAHDFIYYISFSTSILDVLRMHSPRLNNLQWRQSSMHPTTLKCNYWIPTNSAWKVGYVANRLQLEKARTPNLRLMGPTKQH